MSAPHLRVDAPCDSAPIDLPDKLCASDRAASLTAASLPDDLVRQVEALARDNGLGPRGVRLTGRTTRACPLTVVLTARPAWDLRETESTPGRDEAPGRRVPSRAALEEIVERDGAAAIARTAFREDALARIVAHPEALLQNAPDWLPVCESVTRYHLSEEHDACADSGAIECHACLDGKQLCDCTDGYIYSWGDGSTDHRGWPGAPRMREMASICPTCAGTPRVACARCRGEEAFTRRFALATGLRLDCWVTPEATAPAALTRALNRLGAADLPSFAHLHYAGTTQQEDGTLEIRFRGHVAYAAATLEIDRLAGAAHAVTLEAYGWQVRLLDPPAFLDELTGFIARQPRPGATLRAAGATRVGRQLLKRLSDGELPLVAARQVARDCQGALSFGHASALALELADARDAAAAAAVRRLVWISVPTNAALAAAVALLPWPAGLAEAAVSSGLSASAMPWFAAILVASIAALGTCGLARWVRRRTLRAPAATDGWPFGD